MEQLHSVCQSHKDKIKGLFQTKLDEVGVITGLHIVLEVATMLTKVDQANHHVYIILKFSETNGGFLKIILD